MLIIARSLVPTHRKVYLDIPPGCTGRIEIELLEVDRNKARFGITAPDEVAIYREEVQARKDASK